jgi:potassium-transporting ATPase KdpC subunit
MKALITELRTAIVSTIALAVILCGIYPAFVWVVAQGFFPREANGSLITEKATVIGSRLLAQGFTGERYFHPRPSAAGQGYDAISSGGSNLGPISQKLIDTVKQRVADYRKENGLGPDAPVPADAVTTSASGLDPHISVQNALLQARRVAYARGMSDEGIRRRIEEQTEGRTLWILGEPRVNVLKLNLTLDGRR